MALCVLKVQYVQPVFASSEYTVPFWVPTKIRPAATVGWPYADSVSGNANAHFSLRAGTCAAVSPACSAGWKRMLAGEGLQPFQCGPADGSPSGAASICGAQRDGSLGGACAYRREGASAATTMNAEIAEIAEIDLLCVFCGFCIDRCDLIIRIVFSI